MDIISIIAGLLKDTKSLIEFEEQVKILIQNCFLQEKSAEYCSI
ncbi:hypothetical protein NST20_12025 [Weizmannia sp. FSL W8-0676]